MYVDFVDQYEECKTSSPQLWHDRGYTFFEQSRALADEIADLKLSVASLTQERDEHCENVRLLSAALDRYRQRGGRNTQKQQEEEEEEEDEGQQPPQQRSTEDDLAAEIDTLCGMYDSLNASARETVLSRLCVLPTNRQVSQAQAMSLIEGMDKAQRSNMMDALFKEQLEYVSFFFMMLSRTLFWLLPEAHD